MQCERLIKLIKSWYIHVQAETMAPARMVSFMKKHAKSCEICLQDPVLKEEIAKITEIVLPESKIPKAIRQKNEQTALEESDTVDEGSSENDSGGTEVGEEVAEEKDDGEDNENGEESEEGENSTEDDDDVVLDDEPELLTPPDV